MKIAEVLDVMNQLTPPFQPAVNVHASIYQQRLVSWNPVCIKKDALFYQFVTGPDDGCEIGLIPDACMNVLFTCDENRPSALLSGLFLEQKTLTLKPNTTYFGFKPYSNLGMKPNLASRGALTNEAADFSYLYSGGDCLIETIAAARTFGDRVHLFQQFADQNMIDYDYTSDFVDYFSAMICTSRDSITFNNLGQATGYSERYCRDKFKSFYGISPKQYSGMMRFQNALKALLGGECGDLSALALDHGYFDQAHFIHDFKKIMDCSPRRFKQNYEREQALRGRKAAV